MRPTRNRPRTALAVASLAALALALGACSGGGDEPTDAVDTPDDTESTEGSGTDEPTEEPDEEEPAASGAGCVEGSWTSDTEAMAAALDSSGGMAELGATTSVTGESVVTFAGDTLTVEYDALTTEVAWGMEGQDVRMVMTFDGTLTGTVAVDDTTVSFTEVDNSALTLDYATWINEEPLEMPGAEDIVTTGFEAGGSSTYTCTADTLELTPVVAGVDTAQMVTVLHRR